MSGAPPSQPAASSSSSAAAAAAESPPFSLLVHGVAVPVTFAESVPREHVALALGAYLPLREWAARMDPRLVVRSLHVQSVDMFGPRVGFLKFRADARFNDLAAPGVVFMRGGAVAVLIVLRCEGGRWALCCRQPRVPVGCASYLEIPAGMLDGSGHFAGVAAKEIAEETGLVIGERDLIDLTELSLQLATGGGGGGGGGSGKAGAAGAARGGGGAAATEPAGAATASLDPTAAAAAPPPRWTPQGVYPSVGGCDEFLRLLLYARDISKEELVALQGKATGCKEEMEQITLDLVPFDDLWFQCSDAKTHSAILLFEKLAARGLLPGPK